ncbi:MAG: hypothetical protein VW270_07865 [Candidatus Poseidoniales archaeon]
MGTLPRNPFESYEPIQIGDWGCKVSKYGSQIMVFMWHIEVMDTHLQYFDDEYDAVMWMEYMSAKYV